MAWALCGLLLISPWALANTSEASVPAKPASKPEMRVRQVSTTLRDDVYHLDATVAIELGDAAEEALHNGVRLVFAIEMRIFNVRWHRVKREVAFLSQKFSLRYHTLSRQYSLSNLNTQSSANFQTLADALNHLGTVASIPLIDRSVITEESDHFVEFRSRLMLESLPLPLRTTAWFSGSWSLNSGWSVWALKE
jgi:hypothetical protein